MTIHCNTNTKSTPKVCHRHTEGYPSGLNHSPFWSPCLRLKLSLNHPPKSFSKVLSWRLRISHSPNISCFSPVHRQIAFFFLAHRRHCWLAFTEHVVGKIWIFNIRFRLQQHIPISNVTHNHGNIQGSVEMGLESPLPCLLWFHLPPFSLPPSFFDCHYQHHHYYNIIICQGV